MTAPLVRTIDHHTGKSLAVVLLELDALQRRVEALEDEVRELRANRRRAMRKRVGW